MTIARDMEAALGLLTAVRVVLAQDPARETLWTSLTSVQAVLEDCRQRIEAIEGGPVQKHWLPQPAPDGGDLADGRVVVLAQAKQARAVTKVLEGRA
jgi:hypothetical protein